MIPGDTVGLRDDGVIVEHLEASPAAQRVVGQSCDAPVAQPGGVEASLGPSDRQTDIQFGTQETPSLQARKSSSLSTRKLYFLFHDTVLQLTCHQMQPILLPPSLESARALFTPRKVLAIAI